MTRERLYLFDTTLRDGAQTDGVNFSVSTNIVDASFQALHDGITYKLFRDGAPA